MSSIPSDDMKAPSVSDIVEENHSRLRSFVGRLMRDEGEVDDVLQDVFAEFVEAYSWGEAIEASGAWLFRVARNKVFDRFRRKKTQEEYRVLVESFPEGENILDTDHEWMREKFREALISALESLPEDQREVFIRHELEGQSFESISAETGVGINTLLSRKRYAVLSLRENLKEIYDELK